MFSNWEIGWGDGGKFLSVVYVYQDEHLAVYLGVQHQKSIVLLGWRYGCSLSQKIVTGKTSHHRTAFFLSARYGKIFSWFFKAHNNVGLPKVPIFLLFMFCFFRGGGVYLIDCIYKVKNLKIVCK